MRRAASRTRGALALCVVVTAAPACGNQSTEPPGGPIRDSGITPAPRDATTDSGSSRREAGSGHDTGLGQEAGSNPDGPAPLADAYVTSTLGMSAMGGCGLNQPSDTPFVNIGTEGDPVPNGGSFMGSSVSVVCQVSATGTSYNVNAQVGYGPQTGFNFSGTLSNISGAQPNFTAQFTSAHISYNEPDCTVTLNPGGNAMNPSITSGRVWAALSCPALTNMTTSGDVCDGQATFIFQNCAD